MKCTDMILDEQQRGQILGGISRAEIRRVLFATEQSQPLSSCLEFLRSKGVDVRHVSDGRTCLDEALRGKESGTPFDLIVVSIELPVLDGFSTAMLLRENDCARTIISTDNSEHYLQEKQSIQAGCNFHAGVARLVSDLEELLENP